MTQNRREIEQTKYKCTGSIHLCYKYTIHLRGRQENDLPRINKCLNKRLCQYILKIPNKLIAQSIQIR